MLSPWRRRRRARGGRDQPDERPGRRGLRQVRARPARCGGPVPWLRAVPRRDADGVLQGRSDRAGRPRRRAARRRGGPRGAPFVGPAGRLLDRAMDEAGFDRGSTYVTNAVKHFRFRTEGPRNRRIHARPTPCTSTHASRGCSPSSRSSTPRSSSSSAPPRDARCSGRRSASPVSAAGSSRGRSGRRAGRGARRLVARDPAPVRDPACGRPGGRVRRLRRRPAGRRLRAGLISWSYHPTVGPGLRTTGVLASVAAVLDQPTLRSLVVETNDGIIATAGVVEGFAGAGATGLSLVVAAVCATVAGAIALGEPATPRRLRTGRQDRGRRGGAGPAAALAGDRARRADGAVRGQGPER